LDRESFSGLHAQALFLKQQCKEDASDKPIQGMLDAPLMLDQRSLRQVLVKHMGENRGNYYAWRRQIFVIKLKQKKQASYDLSSSLPVL